jgi:tripartite-type tricarboxylate transporter receptor subunit TctC
LAVTSEKREPSLPNIQTVGETIPGYEATAWFGVGMPRGTPPDIINKMNAAINKVMSNPKIRERLAELGGVPITGTPADFGKIIQAETDKWAKVVKFSGATAE